MTNQEKQDFRLRVMQGTQTDLVVTTYDIILAYLEEACKVIRKGDKKTFVQNIKKSKLFLLELMQSLNFSEPISKELFRIYCICNKTLVRCEVKKKNIKLSSVIKIFRNLRDAFQEVAKLDTSGQVMTGSTVYAGLTYGKGTLNESYQPTKGFKA